jgi:hypothetical protein
VAGKRLLRAGNIGSGMMSLNKAQNVQIEFLINYAATKEPAIHPGTNQLDTMLI